MSTLDLLDEPTDAVPVSDMSDNHPDNLREVASAYVAAQRREDDAARTAREQAWVKYDSLAGLRHATDATFRALAAEIKQQGGRADKSTLQEYHAVALAFPVGSRAPRSPDFYRRLYREAKRHPDAQGDPASLVKEWVLGMGRSNLTQGQFIAARKKEAAKIRKPKRKTKDNSVPNDALNPKPNDEEGAEPSVGDASPDTEQTPKADIVAELAKLIQAALPLAKLLASDAHSEDRKRLRDLSGHGAVFDLANAMTELRNALNDLCGETARELGGAS